MDLVYNGLQRPGCVNRYYKRVGNKLIWIENGKLRSQADSLLKFIASIRYYGLLPDNYHFRELRQCVDNPDADTRTDALLTDTFFSLAHDLKKGRTHQLFARADSVDFLLLNEARANGVIRVLQAQEPGYTAYHTLKRALAQALDTSSLRASLLDGFVSDTLDLCRKIQCVEVNLERWRNETTIQHGRYLLVNIPSFSLQLISNDSVILESRTIVGKPVSPTPELSSKIDCFTIFPYWYVPRRISVEEYLPLIKKDRSFLTKNRFDVINRHGDMLNIDSLPWKEFSKNNFPVILRQREGEENSLGIIKFNFDNRFAVYLHDTNARHLFRPGMRAFSHGCIRMERATDLAHYLLTNRIGLRSASLNRYFNQEQRRMIEVSDPLPIHIRYLTCDVRDKSILFYKDIYRKDPAISDVLYAVSGDAVPE